MKSFKQFLNKRVLTVTALAKKHGVDEKYIEKQLEAGIKVEHEHTSKLKVARQIALAHLGEDPDYYKKLKKIEKKTLKEERRTNRPIHTRLSTVLSDPGMLKRTFEKRKFMSDKEIGETLGSSLGTEPYNRLMLKDFLDNKIGPSHPHYVPSLNKGHERNPEDFKKTIVGLSQKGHSASSIADFLHSKERPVSKNKVIGILSRTPNEEKQEIKKEIEGGNEPEEYSQHKNKPVVKKLEGKAGWKTNIKEETMNKEERIKKFLNILQESKKEPLDMPEEQAQILYKELEKHADRMKNMFKGVHPDIQDLVNAHLERISDIKTAANKIAFKKRKRKVGF